MFHFPPTFAPTSYAAAVTANLDAHTNLPPASPRGGGIVPINKEDYLKQLIDPAHEDMKKPLIVIDGPNVACKHGRDQEISSEGIKLVLDYYTQRGHDAIAFLPQQYVRGRKNPKEGALPVINLPLLNELVEQGKVILTPPQDYDDSYCINYAMKHDACIVSNDRYWDHIDRLKTENEKRMMKQWLRGHVISFTFVRDEFLPNPNFHFFSTVI
jgi:hypothetical protein